ncbi:MAG: hypothetical protein ABJN38_11865 [Lentilitoribacter sp.]
MKSKHWAIFALNDIREALDEQEYEIASGHIEDAINAILVRDGQEIEARNRISKRRAKNLRTRL